MHMQTTAKSLPPEILDRCEGLQNTAEYILSLALVVEHQIDAIRGYMRDPAFSGQSLADVGDWAEMFTIISLLKTQADIVKDASASLDDARHHAS